MESRLQAKPFAATGLEVMMRRTLILSGLMPATIGVLLVASPTAGAQTVPAGSEFGHHVAECAQTMGFDGAHNPGMHRGVSSWDGTSC
jgi:hypothetical protein